MTCVPTGRNRPVDKNARQVRKLARLSKSSFERRKTSNVWQPEPALLARFHMGDRIRCGVDGAVDRPFYTVGHGARLTDRLDMLSPIPSPRMPDPPSGRMPDIALDLPPAVATGELDHAAPALAAEVDSRRASSADGRWRPSLVVAFSVAMHVLPLALVLFVTPTRDVPVNAGDEFVEVEMVLAEAATEAPSTEASAAVTPEPPKDPPSDVETPPPEPDVEPSEPEPVPATIRPQEPPAPPPTPPLVATQEIHAAADESWGRLVARHLSKFKRFPPGLGRGFTDGRVVVRFSLSADGEVRSTAVDTSSGNPALDAEALETVRRASPFPARPRRADGDSAFLVPITDRLPR